MGYVDKQLMRGCVDGSLCPLDSKLAEQLRKLTDGGMSYFAISHWSLLLPTLQSLQMQNN